jgi:WD40 repeat protein
VAKSRQQLILTGHSGESLSVAFSLDGEVVASGAMDWTVRGWDVQTGAQEWVKPAFRHYATQSPGACDRGD